MKIWRTLFCFSLGFILTLVTTAHALAASGDVIFEDSFTNRSKVNTYETTAVVDTVKGEVRLPQTTGNQSFTIKEDSLLVQNGGLVELYLRDVDGSFIKALDYTDEEVISLSFTGQGFSHYSLKKDGTVTKMEFASDEFLENPIYKLSGFKSAVTIAGAQGKVFVGETNNHVSWFVEGEEALHQIEEIALSFEDNLSQVAIGSGEKVIVSGKESIHLFRFDGEGYVSNPLEELAGLGYGVEGDEDEIIGESSNTITSFRSGMEILSFNHNGAIAVQALPGGKIYIRDGNSITEYAFDGTEMIPVNTLSGLSPFESEYLSPRQYQSKLFSFPEPTKRFLIEALTSTPGNTTVNFRVSPDGVNFYPVINGVVELPLESSQLVVRATLANDGNTVLTPIIFSLRVLDHSLAITALETTEIVRDPGGNPPLPTELPVRLTAGYNFSIRVPAPGAKEVKIEFSNGEMVDLLETNPYVFEGTHYFQPDIEIGTILDAKVTAKDEGGNEITREFLNHYHIADNIAENLAVYDTK